MQRMLVLVVWMVLVTAPSVAGDGMVISGRVVEHGSSRPVSDAQVEVTETFVRTVTHHDGSFTLTLPHPGTYTLRISRAGYTPASTEITLQAGEQRTMTLELRELS